MSHSLRAESGRNCSEKTPDDGQRNCPKHVEFYSKNKFEKLENLVGFIRPGLNLSSSLHRAFRRVI